MEEVKDPMDCIVPITVIAFMFYMVFNKPQCLKN